MVPEKILDDLLEFLSDDKKAISFVDSYPVSGGSINETFVIETTDGKYFLKYNSAGLYPGMFEKEAMGLRLLSDAGEIRVPEVVNTGTINPYAYLLLEHIDSSSGSTGFWHDFGTGLARLHRNSADKFGLDHDNFIGSLPQRNNFHDNWPEFFCEERLEVQIRMARDSGKIQAADIHHFNNLFARCDRIFPEEQPALIHGDLWSGNYMVDDNGKACIIDPAVYYGHREMDIGMSRLFGVFDESFYRAYNEEYPMETGWRERMDIYNLYPLMVHVNLFGEGYSGSVRSIIRIF